MTDVPYVELILIGLAVSACPVVMRVLAKRVQPARLSMADLGKELLSSSHLKEDQKIIISMMLDDASDWRVMCHASVGLPWIIVKMVLGRDMSKPRLSRISDSETRDKVDDFVDLHIKSTAAANPLFAVVFGVELALLVLMLAPFGMVKKFVDITHRVLTAGDIRQLKHT